MPNPALAPPHVIARRIPRCPCCDGFDHYHVTENTEDGFRLRGFNCGGCCADIPDLYRRTKVAQPGSKHDSARQLLLVVTGALMVLMIIANWLF